MPGVLLTITSDGHTIEGAIVSSTVTIAVQVELFPAPSVAIKCTVNGLLGRSVQSKSA